ncbi:unnamed protein product [Ambrosiozyma monospora]|uniref:Unnamed protein product n=1 Tax=Ambrosiozyma monospora TaxID=43982 RepID=A0ACB5TVV1_AMBMO|nr:unnamed protein product [Ambrosiozyma monospora]
MGAPTAVLVVNWLMALLLSLYTIFISGYQCFPVISTPGPGGLRSGLAELISLVFKDWSRILKLAGPGVLMIEAEWLAYEIITFAASRFGTEALAAQSIVSTTCIMMFQIPYAISVASSTRIAWFIGSASKTASITSTNSAILLAFIVGSINCIFMFTFKRNITQLFSSDSKVIDLASHVLILSAGNQVLDVVACVCGGILRGQGRQHVGGWLNLLTYYVLALPAAFFCGFNLNLGLFGLWIGMVVAITTIALGELWFVMRCDWDFVIQCSIQDGLDQQLHQQQELQASVYSGDGDVSDFGFDDDALDVDGGALVPVVSTLSSVNEHSFMMPAVVGVGGLGFGGRDAGVRDAADFS